MTPRSGGVAATEREPSKSHRKARRCRLSIGIGPTEVEGIVDTGASGGNCLDRGVFNALPAQKYRVTSFLSSVCIGINKCPVRILGKILLDFHLTSLSGETRLFREEFNVIESLIHPAVLGLPFLQKFKATLSFENYTLLIGDQDYPLARSPGTPSPPPPHLAAFEARTIPPMSRTMVNVYLTGDQSRIDMSVAEALYVRPFYSESAKEVPQISAHCVVDPRKKIMSVEVINVWPTPIEIEVDAPVAIVDTVNPDLKFIPQPKLNPLPKMRTDENEADGDIAAWWNWEEMEVDAEVEKAIPMPAPFTAPRTDPPPADVFIAPPTEIPKEAVVMESVEEYPEDEAHPIGNFSEGESREDCILEETATQNPEPPDVPSCRSPETQKVIDGEQREEKSGSEFEINYVTNKNVSFRNRKKI